MARARPFAPCLFLPYSRRHSLPKGAVVVNVSSYADPPFCTLSPMWAHGGIPIPGIPGATADCVEGIWQGLKVIRGSIAHRYFSGPAGGRGEAVGALVQRQAPQDRRGPRENLSGRV